MKNLTTRLMAIIAVLALCLTCPSSMRAQDRHLDVESFKLLMTDMTARIEAPMRDQNGEPCALIKVTSNVLGGLEFESPALGITKVEEHTGEKWVYIPAQSKRISIFHKDYGTFRGYEYPVRIEGQCVYEMKIRGVSEGGVSNSNAQVISLTVSPANAQLFIDDEEMPVEDGLFTATMPKGSHTYKIECPDYEPSSGTFDLGDQLFQRTLRLTPKFGYMSFTSYPLPGASVYIDGNLQNQKTPFTTSKLDAGKYNVRFTMPEYFPKDTIVEVQPGGTTTDVTMRLISSKEKKSTFIFGDAAIGSKSPTWGVMVGMGAVNCGYIHARTNFNFNLSSDYTCDENGVLTSGPNAGKTPYYTPGKSDKAMFSFTAGYMRHIYKPLYIFAGAGYGSRNFSYEAVLNDETQQNDQTVTISNDKYSASGLAGELGLVGRFGRFGISLSYQTIMFKYHETGIGLGVFF